MVLNSIDSASMILACTAIAVQAVLKTVTDPSVMLISSKPIYINLTLMSFVLHSQDGAEHGFKTLYDLLDSIT